MAEEREKSDDIALGSEGTLVAEHSSTKKKKGEKLSDDDSLVKKQSKKQRVEAENSFKESTQVMLDSVSDPEVEKSKEISVDSEYDGVVGGDDAKKQKKKREKRKLDDTDLVAEENTDKKKRKKMKPSVVDPEVELNNKDSPMDAFKEKEQNVQGNDLSSVKDVETKLRKKKKKLSENAESNNDVTDSKDAEVQEDDLNSVKDDDDKEQNVDSEAKGNDGEKKKRKKKKKLSENVESNNEGSKDAEKKENVASEVEEHDLNSAKDDDDKEQNVDSESKGNDLNSTEDGEKRKRKKKVSENADINNDVTKENVDSEVQEHDLNSAKDDDKEQNVDSEAKRNDLNSTKDGEKKKRKKKKKVSENAETNIDVTKDAEKKKRKKKEKCSKIDEEEVTTTPSSSSKSAKKVKFSDQVEVFPSSQDTEESGDEDDDDDKEMELVRGKRFTKEEDALVKQAVLDYIENHDLGENGLEMVMNCRSYPEIKGCWKEIESALPWRARTSVYYRAHNLFEEGSKGVWTPEDLELVKQFQAKHGNDWKKLADAMGKHRVHVKDAWRRIRLNMNKGHWSREEYQTLFDLVNTDIKMKAFKEKHSKHGMLRDNIPWMAISDQLGTRGHVHCCEKWYNQLTSPMVKKGIWANVDDYRLLEELTILDAACIDDVDWDNILENRDGDACRKRWNQMVLHIGSQGSKTFAEQVEILSERYCPDLAEDVEDFDNRPFDPEN